MGKFPAVPIGPFFLKMIKEQVNAVYFLRLYLNVKREKIRQTCFACIPLTPILLEIIFGLYGC